MKCAFLDRDGVINVDHGYVGSWSDFDFLPNAIEGMRLLRALGYSLFVVTNQSGIARGLYSESEFWHLTIAIEKYLQDYGVTIERTYFCPHHPVSGNGEYLKYCDCRKPKPGLILQCTEEYDVNLEESILVGDKISDYLAGKAAGVRHIFLIKSGYLEKQRDLIKNIPVYRDLLEVAEQISQH